VTAELDIMRDSIRLAMAGLAALCLALALRTRRPQFLLLLALGGGALAWALTMVPLQRLYALGPSSDRLGNVGLCQVVAAGNSPLHTVQIGQLHFEPFWGVLTAVLSGWSPDRLLALYPWLSLAAAWGAALAVYAGLGGRGEDGAPFFSPWERALAALFAALLWSSPLDFSGSYRDPWGMTVLLKPNHTLGFVVAPLFLRYFAGVRTWKGRVLAGLILHVLAWVFVIHMAYVALGLCLFAAESLWRRRPEGGRDLRDVITAIVVNALAVSPYLVMLLVGYPFTKRMAVMTIPVISPHLLETTARAGFLFALAVWGALVTARRGRTGRLWVAQLAAAQLVWAGYLGLHLVQLARERDEVVYWARFFTAVLAALGAWDLATRAARSWPRLFAQPHARAVAIAALLLPFMEPSWLDPPLMDDYVPASLQPVPAAFAETGGFLRHHTDARAVVAGDIDVARWASALGARRVLLSRGFHPPFDGEDRERFQELLANGTDADEIRAQAARWNVRYVAVTPAFLAQHAPATLAALEARPHFRRVHLSGDPERAFVALLQIEPGRAPGAP
jgi:hypothetical protein